MMTGSTHQPFEKLELHMRRHGDSYWHLHRAIVRDDEKLDHSTIRHWMQGSKTNRRNRSRFIAGLPMSTRCGVHSSAHVGVTAAEYPKRFAGIAG
jgi:hypothetical protein